MLIECSNVPMFKCSNVNMVKLLSERTSGLPLVIFSLIVFKAHVDEVSVPLSTMLSIAKLLPTTFSLEFHPGVIPI